MQSIVNIFGLLMNLIYSVTINYGLTIIIFTIITKVILFPISILVQKNSIKMVKMKPQIDELKIKHDGDKEAFMEAQIDLFEKEKYHPSFGTIPLIIQIPIILILVGIIKNPSQYIENVASTFFCGVNLASKPSGVDYYAIPILAAISTVVLWLVENRFNVLQREASLFNKLATGFITIAVTVYFVFLVPNGVGMYWILGDYIAILQLFILNTIFPPKNYVDYEYLNRIKKEREEQIKFNKESKKESKFYYKKFFEQNNIDNMKFIIFAEGKGYNKYFKSTMDYILENSDIDIHYITCDMKDPILNTENKKIKPYYLSTNRLIPLFMKLEADIVLMTTPDLENLYLKRSIVRKDVEYIYLSHGIGSVNTTLRTGALDYFDSVAVVGEDAKREIRQIEALRGTKEKTIIECGSPLLDQMIGEYKEVSNPVKTVLIAPSWQKDNIMDLCINDILDNALGKGYKVILRPHPQYVRHYMDKINLIKEKYDEANREDFEVQTDFSSNSTVYNADLLITDWSGIGVEYAFTTLKPVLYVNTPKKIMNKDYKKIEEVPIDFRIRSIIGKELEVKDIGKINETILELLEDKSKKSEIENMRKETVYNLGKSASVLGDYIIKRIKK